MRDDNLLAETSLVLAVCLRIDDVVRLWSDVSSVPRPRSTGCWPLAAAGSPWEMHRRSSTGRRAARRAQSTHRHVASYSRGVSVDRPSAAGH
jgi:hypothetical protein